jgi:butyryl-CoA dehydrogenase
VNAGLDEARAFAESVAGVVERATPAATSWRPGQTSAPWPHLEQALDAVDWAEVGTDVELLEFAALGALELGRRAAPLSCIDRLLGGSPLSGDLVRCLVPGRTVVVVQDGGPALRSVVIAEPLAAADGLDVHRVAELGPAVPIRPSEWETARQAWLAAGAGYLAGIGQAALELTVAYVQERSAFGTTLAGLAPVQQLLAGAATAVRGVSLVSTADPGAETLAHAGPAIASACAACQQVTGAIGYTLEYPLHRYTQRARALSLWNETLLDLLC